MLTITESARDELKNILEKNSNEEDEGLRLIVNQPGSFALMLDKEQNNDEVIEHNGVKILLYQKDMSPILDNIVLDCQYTESGRMLIISK